MSNFIDKNNGNINNCVNCNEHTHEHEHLHENTYEHRHNQPNTDSNQSSKSNITNTHDHSGNCGCNINNVTNENNEFGSTDKEKLAKLAFKIKEFCYNSILGFESGYYKTNKSEVKKLQTKVIASYFIVDYHNQSYKALILDSDPYIVEQYGQMHSIISHSYICLLNITLMICKYLIDGMIRELLDDSLYPNYMQLVKIQLSMLLDKVKLEHMLSHKCSGEDIKKCDPNLEIFSIKAREENN